uniref:Glycoside hydrolase 35 catalytic domain-containing protein n=1 Tax=Panagrolaimus sp. JU765 TaxID=591449 RepID=A0AC34RDJ0_9BILA
MKIFFLFLIVCFGATYAIDRSFKIDYENRQFLKDGNPYRYIAGNVFYHRIHPDQWQDRLNRIRAAGCNAIQVYIPWNYHEPFEGQFTFDGNANVTKFLLMAQSLNLSVILRPGPYINAEWEFGGIPYWLLKKDGIQLRRYNDPYISAVKSFFTTLLPKITPLLYKNGGPILMLQVENEYGLTNICDKKYVEWLRDLMRSYVGNDTVLFS